MLLFRFRALTVAAAIALPLSLSAQKATRSVIPPFNVADLDRSVRACQDLNQFANGGWFAKNPIPAAYTTWGSFPQLTDRNQQVVRRVLERAASQAKTTKDPDTRKLGNFYSTCMDSSRAETFGTKPIQLLLDRYAQINSRSDLVSALANEHARSGGTAFSFGTTQDAKNTTRVILSAGQGGLSLPDRDYYLKRDTASEKIRSNYVAHVAKMFELSGESSQAAAADAQRVLSLETALAAISKSRVELRDPNGNYHLISIDSLQKIAPAMDWQHFLGDLNLKATEINVRQPAFFTALNRELGTRPLEDWRAYLRWRVLDGTAPYLSSAFVSEDFRFNSTLNGAKEMQPRWRRCLRMADNLLGDALGREYAKTEFPRSAKAKVTEMVNNLRAVLADRISGAEWMSDSTKKQALAKLRAFSQKVGYPDVWRSYKGLEISRRSLAENVINANRFERRRNLDKLGKPVDRTEWGMTVPTVNAYYSPLLNEIVFPGGRMQPPFFHVAYDDPANYGGVGISIGHEMSHGFDDQGRQFDAAGNIRDWWTPEDARKYTERAMLVEKQYGDYTVLDGLHLNGKLTLGENLADVVGVSIAFEAMERAMQGKKRTLVNGFTPEQRFFLALAQARRAESRPEQLRLSVQTDPHSPGQFRINGPLSNMQEFAKAFGCQPGDAMVRPDSLRARIW